MSKFLNLTKEELLALVEKQEAELVSKKYGLVWDAEREPEQVVLDCEHYLPVLKRVKGKEIKTVKDQGDNILIEGDNYHALMTLNYTHQGKIDVIYIDPPYNTGAQDWKYNNKFVGEDDGYRHSKWLNLMEKRLNIAKNLMKDDAIICVTIDDYELRTLWMLMDKIFGEENHLGTAVIRNNPSGRKTKRKLALVHEYGLFYGRPKSFIKNLVVDLKNKSHKYVQDVDGTWFSPGNLRKQGIDSQAEKNGKLSHRYFSIYYDPKTGQVSTKKKLSVEILPIDPSGEKRIWRRGSHDIDKMYENGDIWCQQTRNGPQIYYKFRGGVSGEPPKSIWYEPQFSASEHGTRILNNILPTREMFQYPKSLYAVMHSIKIMSSKKDAIILDFFAGSGTTGHAVLELNKEDDGSRKFILCTNNDNSICTDVTYPRLQKVIEGYNFHGTEKTVLFEQKLTYSSLKDIEDILEEINNILENNKNNYDLFEKKLDDGVLKIIGLRKIKSKKEGLSGNLQYFKTDLIKKTKNKDQMRFDLTQKCTDMLCVKENIFNLEVQKEDYKIFSSNQKDEFLCVYYNFYDESFDDFIKEIKKIKGQKKIYVFSMDGKADKKLFIGIKDFEVEEIPQKIIDIYKQLVKMNIPVKTENIFFDFEKAQKKVFEDKDKDEGARILRIVLEKTLQKIAQKNGIAILDDKGKEHKIYLVNDQLKNAKIINKVIWEENKTFLTIGNHASHGDYDEYNLKKVESFYQHIQALHNNFGI